MGLRFRKSVKIAPGVKVNLNKKSTSVTFGGKGVHRTISSTGKKTTSVGLPGSGAYYTTSSGGTSGTNKKKVSSSSGHEFNVAPPQVPDTSAALEKFSDRTLRTYRIIFGILSVLFLFIALIGFVASHIIFGIVFVLVAMIPIGVIKSYSDELSRRSSISYSSAGSDGDPYDDLEEQLMSNTDFGVYGFDDDRKKQSSSKGSNGNMPKKPKKKTGCLPLVCALIVLFVLVSFLVGHKSIEKINISADTDTEYHVGDSIPIEAKVTPSDAKLDDFKNELSGGTLEKDGDKITFTPSKTGSFKLYVGSDGVKSNEITVDVVDPAETADVSDDTADYDYDDSSDIDDSSDVADDTSDDVTPDPIVYITDTGSKYHRADCRTLKDSKIEKHLSEVKGSYQPCGVCHPPQ
ncbi:MAG: DUF4236 domain-containing protein [Dorea sp.]|uniref:DUF4236 domain-containing protein n=1 Tax=Dorea sp. TaxID=2040332 RepID=UPI0039958958